MVGFETLNSAASSPAVLGPSLKISNTRRRVGSDNALKTAVIILYLAKRLNVVNPRRECTGNPAWRKGISPTNASGYCSHLMNHVRMKNPTVWLKYDIFDLLYRFPTVQLPRIPQDESSNRQDAKFSASARATPATSVSLNFSGRGQSLRRRPAGAIRPRLSIESDQKHRLRSRLDSNPQPSTVTLPD